MTHSASATQTYSTADVENVVRNFAADLRMIAESSGTWNREKVENYVSDVNTLAKKAYVKFVDVTLLSHGADIKAARYIVNENSGELTASRPGGVLWPRVTGATLRIVIGPTEKWNVAPPDRGELNMFWTSTSDDISHSGLQVGGGCNFTSNAYGFERKDYTA